MSLRGNFNYAKQIMRHPCTNGSMTVAVEAAFRAAVPAIYDLASFGCREIQRQAAGSGVPREKVGNFRPKMFPAPHRGFKGIGGKGVGAIVQNGFLSAFVLEGLAERALYYWLLANIASDFVNNWSTLMYAENGCDAPGKQGATIQIMPQILGGPGTTDLMLGAYVGPPGVLMEFRGFIIEAGLSASVSYHCPIQLNNPTQPAHTTIQLYNPALDKIYTSCDWPGDSPANTGAVGIVSGKLSGGLGVGEEYRLRSLPGPNLCWTDGGFINLTLTGHEVPLVPKNNCIGALAKLAQGG